MFYTNKKKGGGGGGGGGNGNDMFRTDVQYVAR